MSANTKIAIGMIIIALSGLLLGGVGGYIGTQAYLNNKVLKDMKAEGYVLAKNATATADDIVAGKSAYVGTQLIEGALEPFNTSDATAMADYIVRGKTAYVNGNLVVGTMNVFDGGEFIPSTTATTIGAGQYLANDIVIKGDKDLVASNIKRGITLFGISGTYFYVAPIDDPEVGD